MGLRSLLTIGLVLILDLGPATGAGFRARTFHPTPPAPEIQLTASNGTEFRLSQLRGQIVALTFGYTACPDVCPVILAKLAQARAELGSASSRVRVVFVTVDPVHDTPDRLRAHMAAFDATFVGVTGTPEELGRAQRAYGLGAQRSRPPDGPDAFPVNHAAPVYVIDQEGRLRLLFTGATPAGDMAHDLRLLSEAVEGSR